MNIADTLLGLALIILMYLAARHIQKKRARGGCCGCSGCTGCASCAGACQKCDDRQRTI